MRCIISAWFLQSGTTSGARRSCVRQLSQSPMDLCINKTVTKAVRFYEKLCVALITPEKKHGNATFTFEQYRFACLATSPVEQDQSERRAETAADSAGSKAKDPENTAIVLRTRVYPHLRRKRRPAADAKRTTGKSWSPRS